MNKRRFLGPNHADLSMWVYYIFIDDKWRSQIVHMTASVLLTFAVNSSCWAVSLRFVALNNSWGHSKYNKKCRNNTNSIFLMEFYIKRSDINTRTHVPVSGMHWKNEYIIILSTMWCLSRYIPENISLCTCFWRERLGEGWRQINMGTRRN